MAGGLDSSTRVATARVLAGASLHAGTHLHARTRVWWRLTETSICARMTGTPTLGIEAPLQAPTAPALGVETPTLGVEAMTCAPLPCAWVGDKPPKQIRGLPPWIDGGLLTPLGALPCACDKEVSVAGDMPPDSSCHCACNDDLPPAPPPHHSDSAHESEEAAADAAAKEAAAKAAAAAAKTAAAPAAKAAAAAAAAAPPPSGHALWPGQTSW